MLDRVVVDCLEQEKNFLGLIVPGFMCFNASRNSFETNSRKPEIRRERAKVGKR